MTRLLPEQPLRTLEDYVAAGGGRGLAIALEMEPAAVVDVVEQAGLRGRGGAGFPTGVKWRSVLGAAAETASAPRLVVNGAEGEPGTYKDRILVESNPFLVLEGALVARHALGVERVHIGVKARTGHAAVLERALEELVAAGWEDEDVVEVFEGPDEYLFGEETGLLEVAQGNLPLPRWLPPFQQGLYATTSDPHPTAVNNVETLANVPIILAGGVEAFRSMGTEDSPGRMLFTVVGDVESPGVHELPMGTPLRELVVDIAGAREVKAVFSGVSAPVITPDRLDTPLGFDQMRAAGLSLGSGGFVVYDERHCMVRVAATLSNFNAVESCGQCTACKLGCGDITRWLREIDEGRGTEDHLTSIVQRVPKVTDQARCALPQGEQVLVMSLLQAFREEFVDHLGRPCWSEVGEQVPKIVHLDNERGVVRYDPDQHRKQPDWTYAPPDDADPRP